MDIKDAKVGMLVQLDSPCFRGVGTVELISDSGLVQVRLDGVVTSSAHNEGNINNRWRTRPCYFKPYQDPEADMVVWDALEVGEHYIDHEGYARVKMCDRLSYCFKTRTIHPHYGAMDKYEKVKPL